MQNKGRVRQGQAGQHRRSRVNTEKSRLPRFAAAHQLSIKVAQAQHSAGNLPDNSKGLNQQIIQLCAGLQSLPELCGLGLELLICQPLHAGLEVTDLFDQLEVPEIMRFCGATLQDVGCIVQCALN